MSSGGSQRSPNQRHQFVESILMSSSLPSSWLKVLYYLLGNKILGLTYIYLISANCHIINTFHDTSRNSFHNTSHNTHRKTELTMRKMKVGAWREPEGKVPRPGKVCPYFPFSSANPCRASYFFEKKLVVFFGRRRVPDLT